MLISVVAVGFVSDPAAATAGHSPSFGESVTDTPLIPMYQIQPTRPTKVRSTLRSLTSRLRLDTTVALDDTLAFTVTIEKYW